MVQRRLAFLKAVRFGSYVSNKLVWWASCEGLHRLGRIFRFRHILEDQIYDPASAGFFEGRQIWEIRLWYVFSYEGAHSLGRLFISRWILEHQICDPSSADFLKAVRFGRCVLDEFIGWAPFEGLRSSGSIFNIRLIIESKICDPVSAGFFEGRQIWETHFKRTCSLGFLWGPT